jgi:hypothetical protein
MTIFPNDAVRVIYCVSVIAYETKYGGFTSALRSVIVRRISVFIASRIGEGFVWAAAVPTTNEWRGKEKSNAVKERKKTLCGRWSMEEWIVSEKEVYGVQTQVCALDK